MKFLSLQLYNISRISCCSFKINTSLLLYINFKKTYLIINSQYLTKKFSISLKYLTTLTLKKS